ncbi:MAG: 4Fe-4S single cluster domain-containing protein [Pseudomonadota bacterium]
MPIYTTMAGHGDCHGFLRLHAILPCSRSNGPGDRMVIWFQGCSRRCVGCFNPGTHGPGLGTEVSIGSLLDLVLIRRNVLDGITLTGGEPLEQAEGLLCLVLGIRRSTRLSIVLFSGMERGEIERMTYGSEILRNVDVLIDGSFVHELRRTSGLRASSNQTIHLLTGRYRLAEFDPTPPAEVLISPDGSISVSGIDPPTMRERNRP